MIRIRAAASLLPVLLASCASPLGTRAPETGFVQAARGLVQVSENSSGACDSETASSFEDGYRDQCSKRGTAGVAAESMTSVLEGIAALCGANRDSEIEQDGELEASLLADPDEVRALIQF